MATSRSSVETTRLKKYKNVGQSVEEGRKKREEDGLHLRRQRREEQLSKKRNIWTGDEPVDKDNFLEGAPLSVVHKFLYSEEAREQRAALVRIRKLLSSSTNVLIQETLTTGCLPKIVEFLSSSNKDFQFEAAWIITNIASGTSEHTRAVVEGGAVPVLVQLLLSPHAVIRDQALWALGNVSGDSPQMRGVVLDVGVLSPLLKILKEEEALLTVSTAMWVLSHLCKGCSAKDEVMLCLPQVAKLVYHDEVPLLPDTLWCLVYLADGPNEKIQRVIDSGVCRRLAHLLLVTDSDVIIPALRAVGNILTGDDTQAQVMINCSVLPALQGLLKTSSDNIVIKNACWCLSNITAGNRVQIQAVVDCQLFPQLIEVVNGIEDYKTRKEAAWAILNATSGGTDEQIRFLVSAGCVAPLCSMLSVQDSRMVIVTLEGLENILRVGSKSPTPDGVNPYAKIIEEAYGLDKIENLQLHHSEEIGKLAAHLVDCYFTP